MTFSSILKFSSAGFVALSLMTVACQSTAKYSDRSAEITKLEQEKAQFISEQDDVLAPEQFKAFSEELAKAKSLNQKQKDAGAEVKAASGHAYSLREKTKPSRVVLAEALTARRAALAAGAAGNSKFDKIDQDLRDATKEAAAGDIKDIQKDRNEFKNRYVNAEGDAIVAKAIGSEQRRFADLKKGLADTTSPQTFKRTETKLAEAERSIRAARYDATAIAAANALSSTEVARLAKIDIDSRRLKSEPAAIEIYEKEQAALALKAQQDARAAALAAQNSQLQNKLSTATTNQGETAAQLSAAQSEAAKKEALELKFKNAKLLFSPTEAEVYKDGENLLIRLKGLNFAEGKGVLPTQSAALLKKLGTVISDFKTPRVRIEGHTDANGGAEDNLKLSAERADVVKQYLVSQSVIGGDDVVTQGRGEEVPVANNETATGRAQNRRVDVIVQPTY